LLSACLLDGGDVVAHCINAQIEPKSFYVPANRVIFAVILDLMASGKEIASYTIAEELKATRQLDEIGGYAYLTRISGRIPTTAGTSYFIAKVLELSALRETITICTQAVENCYGFTGEPIAEILAPTVNKLLALSAGAAAEKEKDWGEVVDEAERNLREAMANAGKPTGREIPFPWPRMNEVFGPMQRGQLIILAARASIGKSSLARPILANAAELGFKAYYVTLEVNPEKIPLQIASSMAGIGLRQAPRAHRSEQEELLTALRSLKRYGVTISRKDRSIARIEARARALHAKGQLDILFIDHGGYVQDIYKAKAGEKIGACGLLTKTLKTLATELDVPVILLWQLNRNSVQASNREPNLTDLKDSGSLEEDADKVILIHRPDTDPLKCNAKQADTMDINELPSFYQNVIQAKGRDDGTALLSFYFHRQTATFKLASTNTL
jgi:replicative DNA helicase